MPASRASSSSNSPGPPAPRRNRGGLVIVIVLLCVVGALVWWWRTPARNSAAPAAGSSRQPVSVQAAHRQDIRVIVSAIGTINAYNTAVVRAQVSGVLQSLQFKEGQQVQAGQMLAQIDPRAFEASLGQAQGAQARDQAQLSSAKVDLARYQDLFTKDAVSKQQVDTQAATVQQLEGAAKTDAASVDSAKLQLSYAQVKAPIGGRVGLKQADLGNIVGPGDANGIVSIAQTKPISLVFAIPAVNVPALTALLHAGKPVPVEAWDSSGRKRLAVGQVQTLDNAIDTSTDTIKVKAQFANSDDQLFPNQAVSVHLQLEVLPNAMAVPQAAVLNGAKGAYVYVVGTDDVVSAVPVKPGPVDGDWMAVGGAVQAGQRIVVDGVDRIRQGASVEVIPAGAAAAAAAAAGDPASN